MAGQRARIAKLHRAFGNSLDRCRAEWFAARSHWHIEVMRGCDAGRGGALAHPADSPADRGDGRRSGWRSRPAGPAKDHFDLKDEAAGYRSRAESAMLHYLQRLVDQLRWQRLRPF